MSPGIYSTQGLGQDCSHTPATATCGPQGTTTAQHAPKPALLKQGSLRRQHGQRFGHVLKEDGIWNKFLEGVADFEAGDQKYDSCEAVRMACKLPVTASTDKELEEGVGRNGSLDTGWDLMAAPSLQAASRRRQKSGASYGSQGTRSSWHPSTWVLCDRLSEWCQPVSLALCWCVCCPGTRWGRLWDRVVAGCATLVRPQSDNEDRSTARKRAAVGKTNRRATGWFDVINVTIIVLNAIVLALNWYGMPQGLADFNNYANYTFTVCCWRHSHARYVQLRALLAVTAATDTLDAFGCWWAVHLPLPAVTAMRLCSLIVANEVTHLQYLHCGRRCGSALS